MSLSVPAAFHQDAELSGGPEATVARSEGEVIVILTNFALIDRISADRQKIKIL